MRINKKRAGAVILEIIGEVVLTLLCFGIGAIIIAWFGIDFKELDGDWIVLIGVGVLIAVILLAYFLTQWLKKINKKS